MESSSSFDSSVWSIIKSRCPPPEINEARIKIGRTLLQENEALYDEKSALQSILYELHGDRLKKSRKQATSLDPHPPSGNREGGGGNRLFRDALLYSKLHYETSDLSTDSKSFDGKPGFTSPSKIKTLVKSSSSTDKASSLTAIKSNRLHTINVSMSLEEIISIISSVSNYNLNLIETHQTSIQAALMVENQKLTDLCESYRRILEGGLDDHEDTPDTHHKSNNNDTFISGSRGGSSNSKTRERFRGVKEDIYFMDD